MGSCCCDDRSFRNIQIFLSQCTKFITHYQWIIDAYVSDFFTHGYWEQLPPLWRDILSQMEPPELAFLLQGNTEPLRRLLPLSLLAYRQCCHVYSLPRERIDVTTSSIDRLFQCRTVTSDLAEPSQTSEEWNAGGIKSKSDIRTSDVQVEPHCDVGVTETDQSEILYMSQVQQSCSNADESRQINYLVGDQTEISSDISVSDIAIKTSQIKSQCHSNVADCRQAKSQIKHGQYLPLQHCFRKHVKPKKQHEILQLGQVLNMLGDTCSCKHIVDVGAGQGHLSRVLNFGFGFKVTTVEAAGHHAPKAQKFDRDIKKELDRAKLKRKNAESKEEDCNPETTFVMVNKNNETLPDHVTCVIQPDTSVDNFMQIVQSSLEKQLDGAETAETAELRVNTGRKSSIKCPQTSDTRDKKGDNLADNDDGNETSSSCTAGDPCVITEKLSCLPKTDFECFHDQNSQSDKKWKCDNSKDTNDKKSIKFILTGLHACGNLTPTILKVYSRCPDIVGLASVSCCYMKLTCSSSGCQQPGNGYPLSKYVQSLTCHHLSYEAREMACHFADSYMQRLKDNPPSLQLHCYRAALQYIINEINPNFTRGCIKLTVKNAENMEFKQYVFIGLKRLGIDAEVPIDILQTAESYLPLWRAVIAFYTVRLSLAPVVETLILMDRMVYLYEQGLTSCLVPIFDPSLSPRNFVLLSRKFVK